jgi:N-acetylglucosaminyldiphosphoundecaprenol N-acetyl-beta-D-mannosaminyltransferase
MPVIWASRLAGTPLPQRVSGADLIWSLSRGLGRDGRSIFVLGGQPVGNQLEPVPVNRSGPAWPNELPPASDPWAQTWPPEVPADVWIDDPRPSRHAANAYREVGDHRNAGPSHRADERRPRNAPAPFQRTPSDGAGRAATALLERCPGLQIAGAFSPPFGFDVDPEMFAALRDEIVAARPDLVLVGIGFPKQERVIASLRADLPGAWFLGCGQAINFAAGEQRRAPTWMQRIGVEWLHRMVSEPRRLAERYLRHDLPFALSLLARSAVGRYRSPAPRSRHGR